MQHNLAIPGVYTGPLEGARGIIPAGRYEDVTWTTTYPYGTVAVEVGTLNVTSDGVGSMFIPN